MSETGAYPSPKISGFSLEREETPSPSVRRGMAETAAPSENKPVKIILHGENFIERAMFPIIRIGDLRVKKCGIAPDGKSITCYFERMPEEGAEIFVGYGAGEAAVCKQKFTCRHPPDPEP